MIQFSKLRLNGFKSFVDRTELEITPGLNGIVGPNGCGKSNLVEALRWSMGESSSKRMRGASGSMEDVIFNGTARRSARNVAEVSVLLDNTKRTAPAPYNNFDEIEVVRRIEKDKGSEYRINGKSVRARDVQMLYADILSGANSPFLVSQGKITEMIRAKPSDRKKILEEAAGISGIYARRHEAELRLKATERNLERLEDLLGGMESRLRSLKTQARQANRYKNLSAQIRQLDVMIASLEWKQAKITLTDIERTFGEAESAVAEHMTVVSQLTKTHNTQAADLPALRKADAEATAALQAQKLALQRLEDEAQRLADQLEESHAQKEQAETDSVHEATTLEENTATLAKLETEEASLANLIKTAEEGLVEQEEAKEKLQEQTNTLEEDYTSLTEIIATARARRESLERQISRDLDRKASIEQRIERAKTNLAENFEESGQDTELTDMEADITRLEELKLKLQDEIKGLEQSVEELETLREEKREERQQSQNDILKIESEINSLESILKAYSEGDYRPVFEDMQTDDGFELAVSRALGDTLMASEEDDAPVLWAKQSLDLSSLPALPQGTTPLSEHVKAPKNLQAALNMIGIIHDQDSGDTLAKDLKPGQALVSPKGGYWRWDGLRIKIEATDRHAIQIKQTNKLAELKKALPAQQKTLERMTGLLEEHTEKLARVKEEREEKRTSLKDSEKSLNTLRRDIEALRREDARTQAEKAKFEQSLILAKEELTSLLAQISENETALNELGEENAEDHQEKLSILREELNEARSSLHEAIRAFENSKQTHSRHKARLQGIGDERVNLKNRNIRARERLKELETRKESLTEKIDGLKKRPDEIKAKTDELLEKITKREAEQAIISDKLAQCETELAETTKALKDAEAALSSAREARAHAQATAAERQKHLQGIEDQIREQFDMAPGQLAAEAAISDEKMPDLSELKREREQAVRNRDQIGPVNLRAEQEADELDKELGGILSEKNDLVEAVDELRTGITKLNKEARERLEVAFNKVNGYFVDMFTRLFRGGKAHLELIDSDDPLEAGLEIYAQPPGKALQSLTLLSGGEQTLTAIALIFAMFLTNPAPICVLDEVDAPLDDANVDRFCDLLEEFSDRGETRFLIITHHRLTMARMDRLYGVTMAEKGISQLVSVDMNQQLDFLDEAA